MLFSKTEKKFIFMIHEPLYNGGEHFFDLYSFTGFRDNENSRAILNEWQHIL